MAGKHDALTPSRLVAGDGRNLHYYKRTLVDRIVFSAGLMLTVPSVDSYAGVSRDIV